VDSSLEITSIAISPDGKRLVIGTADAKLELWDLVQRKLITSLSSTHTDAIFHLTFSRAGKILASGDGATIILWDLEKREAVGQSFRGSEPALSPNGNILAVVVSSDSATVFDNILLWDIKTHQPIGHTLIHPMHLSASEVTSLAFSPDNNTLASISNDGTTVLWDLKPESWIRISCQRSGRNLTIDEWEQYGFTEPYRKTCDQWP
jgi:WD40 repeat protein